MTPHWMHASVGLLAMLLAGCSSSDSGASGPMTVEQWCAQGPAQLCAARRPCCESGAVGWDRAKCEANEKLRCISYAAAVKLGARTFDPGATGGCVEATSAAAAKCRLGTNEYLLLAQVDASCDAVFPGALAEGSPCTSSTDCAAPAGSVAVCDGSKCKTRAPTTEGGACVGAPGACDTIQQYCDSWTTPAAPTCNKPLGVGQPCPHGVECERTLFCDPATTTCAQPLQPGQPCVSNTQCQSFTCGLNNECGPDPVFLSKSECGAS